jgi:hypothetical protein
MACTATSSCVAIVAGVLTAGVVHAAPVSVDVVLTSNNINTSFQTVELGAGIWDIDLRTETVAGSPNWIAWNPWGFASTPGCDASGANCDRGWLNDYRIKVGDNDSFGVNLPRIIYRTAELARDNFSSFALELSGTESVRFSISDGTNPETYLNNAGGLSLRLVLRDVPPPESVVPLPGTLPMVLSGLLLLGMRGRTR